MTQFFVNADEMTAIKEVTEDAVGNFAVITKADELLETFPKKEDLIKLRTSIRGKEAKGDQNKSAKKLAFEIFEQMGKDPKPEKKAKEKKPPKITKVSMARDILLEKTTIKKADLAEAIGHDLQNCHTMISILKNAKRTKKPLYVSYNKATTEYTLQETEEEMIAANAEFDKAISETKKKAGDEKKAAADKKAADKKAADKKAADKKAADKKA